MRSLHCSASPALKLKTNPLPHPLVPCVPCVCPCPSIHLSCTQAPRFAPWGAVAAVGGLWFVWPALTQDFKANALGVGMTKEAEKEAGGAAAVGKLLSAQELAGEKMTDYSATGAIRSFKTRVGAHSDFEDGELDKMPTNVSEEATAAVIKAVTKHKQGGIQTIAAVDAIRSFKTRQGAKYEFSEGDLDKMPTLGGGKEEVHEEEEHEEEEEEEE